MSKSAALRTDGVFGSLYDKYGNDILTVIAVYRLAFGLSYHQAWAEWFYWASS